MTTQQFDTITMQLTMQCPSGDGATYLANLRAAFARKYPELVTTQIGTDQNGNPITANDPDGVAARATVAYWFLATFAEDAMAQGAAAAKAQALAALANVQTTVTLNSVAA